ncbi:MAG: isoleucine--tRNA ligase, partial [Oscillospiraceae bacterium]|nr:isoleucine--tRNA ligase [Oscillospiraceae bacterium]
KKGYIYKGFKPVYWCPKDETALAEAEIEYKDDPCTTVYVRFPLHDDQGKLGHLELSRLSVLIWTTTIWTLPGNLAIALHPDEQYAIVKNTDSGELFLLAEPLVNKVMGVGGIEHYEIVETHPGSFFEGMLASHPFLPKTSLLCCADYVTMDSGTGCVHTAPGFGVDDYNTCARYGIEMVVPVDDRGRHTDYAGKYAGMTTAESNPVIWADMKESGALFASEEIVHSYPHCWRCKGEIIFRATPQWFCSVDAFKEEACSACDDVRWVPDWGVDRIKSMVRERSDWCISRQRKWGLPIPVFYCPDCGKPVVTDGSIAAVSDLFAAEGSNAWFTKEAKDILPVGFTCPSCGCGRLESFTKEEDTLDGWFDSGSSHFASMQRDQGFWPATVYLEGLDQYRGWFQSSLLTAVGALGKGAPFKECITHGWTVDGQGRAMHKSLGNGVDPGEVMDKYGADILRLWAASADYHADVRCSDEIFKQLSQNYLKFRNTARYCLGNLDGFDPDRLSPPAELDELDKWALTRLNALMEKCFRAYDDYEFAAVTHAVNDFCVVDLSNFYLDVIKDRLYCESRDGRKRRAAQTALFLILDTMTKLMAPILCYTCDEIWQAMPHRSGDDGRNVLFNEMNRPFTDYASGMMDSWASLTAVRDGVNAALENARAEKKLGKSLEAKVTLVKDSDEKHPPRAFTDGQLADLFIVSAVEVKTDPALYESAAETPVAGVRVLVEPAKGEKCPRCWKRTLSPDADGLCPRCAEVVSFLN